MLRPANTSVSLHQCASAAPWRGRRTAAAIGDGDRRWRRRVAVMRVPPRRVGAGRAGEGEEHVVERGLAAVEVDGVDAGGVERPHDVHEARALEHGDGRDAAGRGRASAALDANALGGAGRPRRARAGDATVTSMRSVPMRAFSSSGVPCATVRPWSSTTMSSASWSASSRYCVVRMTVVPSRTRSRSIVPEVVAAARVEAGGRLVEEQHRRARRPGSRRGRGGGACRRRTSSRAGRRRRRGRAARAARRPGASASRLRQVVEPADHHEVLPRARAARRRSPAARRRRCARRTASGSVDDVEARHASPCPRSGAESVVRMRIAVVLPAPLWPSRPRTVPGATSRSRSRRAQRSPKRLPEAPG